MSKLLKNIFGRRSGFILLELFSLFKTHNNSESGGERTYELRASGKESKANLRTLRKAGFYQIATLSGYC